MIWTFSQSMNGAGFGAGAGAWACWALAAPANSAADAARQTSAIRFIVVLPDFQLRPTGGFRSASRWRPAGADAGACHFSGRGRTSRIVQFLQPFDDARRALIGARDHVLKLRAGARRIDGETHALAFGQELRIRERSGERGPH